MPVASVHYIFFWDILGTLYSSDMENGPNLLTFYSETTIVPRASIVKNIDPLVSKSLVFFQYHLSVPASRFSTCLGRESEPHVWNSHLVRDRRSLSPVLESAL
jgi:hypothetical protein